MKTPEEIKSDVLKRLDYIGFDVRSEVFAEEDMALVYSTIEITTSELSARHDEEMERFADWIAGNEYYQHPENCKWYQQRNLIASNTSELLAEFRKQDIKS